VANGKVFGGGLSISFSNIEELSVACQEGNDLVSVLSTTPTLSLSLFGYLGTDRFVVTPRRVDPVVSKNLRGHRGILEHEISSMDDQYDGLLIQGVAVDVLDNDGTSGYINIVENETVHLLSEDGDGNFSFSVYPTRQPEDKVVVDIGGPTDEKFVPIFKLNNFTEAAIRLEFTSMIPQTVRVEYNPAAEPLDITDVELEITSDLAVSNVTTDDENFIKTAQTILPVNVKLIPGANNTKAKAVTVVDPDGSTIVAEGNSTTRITASYEIYLRPCTIGMKEETFLQIVESVPGQLQLSKYNINGVEWGSECKVDIDITAVDDSVEEGDHFVTLSHIVTDSADNEILLSDNSTLIASSVLVRIYDDDIGGVVLKETLTSTSTAEIDEGDIPSGLPSDFYEDTYSLRLTKQPASDVSIKIISIPVASDRLTPSTALLDRNYTERIQALVGESQTEITIVFTSEDWYEWKEVRVSAENDMIEEGVDWLNFPSQPSYLSFIQGPISFSGEASENVPGIADPLLLPGEIDTEFFIPPNGADIGNSSLSVIEEKQVDRLQIYNVDVRGNSSSIGILSSTNLAGMNMAKSGIDYADMEVVEIFLGNGTDEITVVDTSIAVHFIDLGGGDDHIRVKDVSGPLVVHGKDGEDTLTVSSDESKLDKIQALLVFDGGSDVASTDSIIVNNTGDQSVDDVLNVTRLLVEVPSMAFDDGSLAPKDSYLINLRGATGGNFTLEVSDPESDEPTNVTMAYTPNNASLLESLIQRALIPLESEKSCGSSQTSKCSNAVRVWQMGDGYAVFFVGERLNSTVAIRLFTDDLESFEPELFQNKTNDILRRNSDLAYANVEKLDIAMGNRSVVVNVRGKMSHGYMNRIVNSRSRAHHALSCFS